MSSRAAYAQLPKFTYHSFDLKTVKYTNIPNHGLKKLEEEKAAREAAKKEAEKASAPPEDATGMCRRLRRIRPLFLLIES